MATLSVAITSRHHDTEKISGDTCAFQPIYLPSPSRSEGDRVREPTAPHKHVSKLETTAQPDIAGMPNT